MLLTFLLMCHWLVKHLPLSVVSITKLSWVTLIEGVGNYFAAFVKDYDGLIHSTLCRKGA